MNNARRLHGRSAGSTQAKLGMAAITCLTLAGACGAPVGTESDESKLTALLEDGVLEETIMTSGGPARPVTQKQVIKLDAGSTRDAASVRDAGAVGAGGGAGGSRGHRHAP
jgi:hypothetical protein